MASLEMNKIAAGVLCAGLLAMAAGKIADVLVSRMILKRTRMQLTPRKLPAQPRHRRQLVLL